MNEFITVISNLGFPIALSAYLLYRFEKKIESLTESIDKLVEMMK